MRQRQSGLEQAVMEQHTVKNVDKELHELAREVAEMGKLVQKQVATAINALVKNNRLSTMLPLGYYEWQTGTPQVDASREPVTPLLKPALPLGIADSAVKQKLWN